MKVHVYLLCYNEENIIRNVLDYYLRFCTKVFILDNMSTDSSVDIAKSFGDKVEVISWESGDKIDESLYVRIKTRYYKEFSREGGKYTREIADWVISCDMDELLYHPDILGVLSQYKKMGVTVPQITGFNMVGDNELVPSKGILSQYSEAVRKEEFDKRIIFAPEFDMAYSYGCHPNGVGFEYMKNSFGYKTSNKFELALLHYKFIGERWVEAARRNSERIVSENVKQMSNGRFQGLGSHYFNIVNGFTSKPSGDVVQKLFGDNGNVNFSLFDECTGERGFPYTSSIKFTEVDVDLIRDVALDYGGQNKYSIAYSLMLLAKRARPNGPLISNKLKEYKLALDKISS